MRVGAEEWQIARDQLTEGFHAAGFHAAGFHAAGSDTEGQDR
jgi:hypothetical protein